MLQSYGRVAVGFSGGVDSAFLLWSAVRALGRENVLAVVADTPTLPRRELAEALRLAGQLDAQVCAVTPNELGDPAYAANPPERCYICKRHIFSAIRDAAAAKGFDILLDGSNADDANDIRPGSRAAAELGVRSPLAEIGVTKREIRAWSEEAGLLTAHKPAMACLATRIPFGTRITLEALAQVERAEDALRGLGFAQCRVRHHGDVARVEVAEEDMGRLLEAEARRQVAQAVKAAGFRFAALDLLGYRMGSLNS
ncbi:MAG: ATP-dependent sacrificial sulfur transferase LarE [Kiritimatiellaeota bacterium]|nr:ATP-dependent sacrificial sulfur transferase LarE [Kiritimatiellota bacterium]